MPSARSRPRASGDQPPASAGSIRLAAPTPAPLTIPSTEAQNEFGRVLDQAAAGQDIAIARHNVVRAVLVSASRYRELVGHDTRGLDELADQFEELYDSMQTPEVQEATARGLAASPEEMGRAAIAAARRSHRRGR